MALQPCTRTEYLLARVNGVTLVSCHHDDADRPQKGGLDQRLWIRIYAARRTTNVGRDHPFCGYLGGIYPYPSKLYSCRRLVQVLVQGITEMEM